MQCLCTASGTCIFGDCVRALAQAKCKAGILKWFLSMSTFCVKAEVDFFCMLILLLDWSQLYFETSTLTKMGQIFGQIAEKPIQ